MLMNPVRLAVADDLPRLVAIYNQAIASGGATADISPYTVASRRAWFEEHAPDSHPIFVFDGGDGTVTGYLSLSPYRGRPALRRTAEVSYYVDYAHHGRGIGSALMAYAVAEAPRTGKKILLAIVLEGNAPSVHLLEKFSFVRWGFLPEVAELDGNMRGHLYYGRKV
jgi:L-amino acid N-acyltransferase YncA